MLQDKSSLTCIYLHCTHKVGGQRPWGKKAYMLSFLQHDSFATDPHSVVIQNNYKWESFHALFVGPRLNVVCEEKAWVPSLLQDDPPVGRADPLGQRLNVVCEEKLECPLCSRMIHLWDGLTHSVTT